MSRRTIPAEMKVIPRFVYNPEKSDRGLWAMAEILASALRRNDRPHLDTKNPTSTL